MARMAALTWLVAVHAALIYCAVRAPRWIKCSPDVPGVVSVVSILLLGIEAFVFTIFAFVVVVGQ